MEIARSVIAAALLLGTAAAQQVPKLSDNLHEIANLKTFEDANTLTKADIAMLRKNWFFVAPSDSYYVYGIYGRNDYDYIPSLITSDNAVQLLHVCFDSTLEQIERTKLASGARKMSAALLAVAVKDWKAAANTGMAPAAAKNAAYFGVADRLSGGKEPIPAAIMPMVTKTLALVKEHGGFTIGPILPYEVDFSQFVPRGHYTRSPLLSRYFQAMMWFGLTPLSAPKEPGDSLDPIRQAVLMSHELTHSDQLARWNRMYDVTTMLMGPSNHLTPLECEACAKKIFGSNPTFKDWADPAKVHAVIDELGKARPPVFMEDVEFPQSPSSIQVRFFGQRGSPDSYILQTLSSMERKKPSPLDVMAAIGSAPALSILNSAPKKYNPKDWPEYVPRRSKLIEEFAAEKPAQWTSDIYWSWMDCLRALIVPQESAGQPFLQTPAWADKSLYTALASWTEMKHDTILYSQQSVAAEGGEEERAPNLAKGFVEPSLTLYLREKALLTRLKTELDRRTYLSSDLRKEINALSGILDFFITVSREEIAHKRLSEAEYLRIRNIEGALGDVGAKMLVSGSGIGYQNLSSDDMDPALVADFATADDTALEAGVGRCDHVYAIVRVEGKLYLMRGASLSFFEFERPSSDRMTDHEWKKQLESGKILPRSSWIHTFFQDKPVKERE